MDASVGGGGFWLRAILSPFFTIAQLVEVFQRLGGTHGGLMELTLDGRVWSDRWWTGGRNLRGCG